MKTNKPSKTQKKSWYDKCKQQQNPQGKGKANEVTFVNEVEMFNASVENEDDLLFQFIDHLEEGELANVEMEEDTSSMMIHMGWHDEDNGFNVAGPSSQPFQCTSLECPF